MGPSWAARTRATSRHRLFVVSHQNGVSPSATAIKLLLQGFRASIAATTSKIQVILWIWAIFGVVNSAAATSSRADERASRCGGLPAMAAFLALLMKNEHEISSEGHSLCRNSKDPSSLAKKCCFIAMSGGCRCSSPLPSPTLPLTLKGKISANHVYMMRPFLNNVASGCNGQRLLSRGWWASGCSRFGEFRKSCPQKTYFQAALHAHSCGFQR